MAKKTNPYTALPPAAFWRSGVAEAGIFGLSDLWTSKWQLPADARFATYGSCFAQHISRALLARKLAWVDAEPAPARTPPALAQRFNYGVFSARTANIYTAAQLCLLVRLAVGKGNVAGPEIWAEGGRHYDSLRPTIEPGGFASRHEAIMSRTSMLRAFRRSVERADVFVFTLGLTEGWENAETGQAYAMCPGTAAGRYDPALHRFCNYGYIDIGGALQEAFELMSKINPDLRFLLTVSPVPLTATASGRHVLVASTYSKSVLRAVAGDFAASDSRVDYFPAYEIITGAPSRSAFFDPNLRSVVQAGVEVVMGHFFAGLDLSGPAREAADAEDEAERAAEAAAAMQAEDLACEEATLEGFNSASRST